MKKNFILIGAAGYIAPRHFKAIKDLGGHLLAILDPSDSVGVIDSYFPEAHYFDTLGKFESYIVKLKSKNITIDYVSVCSPNYLHIDHIKFGLRHGADVICEKPVVLTIQDIDILSNLERESGKNVYTILQLRYHPALIALKNQVEKSGKSDYKIKLDYITARGAWYAYSWKGDQSKSGGIATNIGIHFFDILTWIFGSKKSNEVFLLNDTHAQGKLILENAEVEWNLSIDEKELPLAAHNLGQKTHRAIQINKDLLEFSDGFANLHTKCYEEIVMGRGFGLEEVRESVKIVSEIRK